MAERGKSILRIEYPGAFYHLTPRRSKRKKVFQSNWIEENIYLVLNRVMSDMSKRFAETIKRNQDLSKVFSKIEKEGLLNVAA